MSFNLNTPDGWQELSADARDSTIAYFKGGAECKVEIGAADMGDEVLIWHGVEDPPDEFHLESHLGNDIPSDAEYLIEVKNKGTLVRERFAKSSEAARERANEELQRLHNGDI